MLKVAIIVLGSLMALMALAAVVGALLPRRHRARRAVRLGQSPAAVWDVITDHAAEPAWRDGLARVERLPDREGHPVWRELSKSGDALALETVEGQAPRRLVRRIADPDLPFGGTWTYELEPADGGCALSITEDGEVKNPIFRFASRFLMGHTATLDRYLRALGRRFGQDVAPV